MKVIISSEAYPSIIERAIKKRYKNFYVDGSRNKIRFFKSGRSQVNNIKSIVSGEGKDFGGKFNHLQWWKLSEFLKQLPEQPVVLEFLGDNNDRVISIRVSGIVQTF
jgi:hypothetical protein